jgi:G:T-mismatch repair DNA endonuclease (very short patch repair protein)
MNIDEIKEKLNKQWFSRLDPVVKTLSSQSHYRRKEMNKVFTKDFFEFAFINGLSANKLANIFKEFGFEMTAGSIIGRCKKLGVKTLSISESCFLIKTIESKKISCLEKYGVENPSQSELIKKKKERKALKVYGCKNVFQSEEIKSKSKKTCMEKYGVEHIAHRDDQLEKMRNCGRHSKLQDSIENILTRNSITFESENGSKFLKFNDKLNKTYSPRVDILIPELKIVVEVNGDVWHANPKMYKPNDVIYKYAGATKASDIWVHDDIRKKQIESFGYRVIIVWERDYHHNKQLCERKLINAIKKRRDKINKENSKSR